MATRIKVINTEEDYREALKLVEDLISKDPDPDSEAGEKLHLLSTLVADYESRMFPMATPDPVDAILFRMEQQNLKPRDLVPFLGSRSKVSEILSRKRPLTLSMMRALESGLGIPARVLIKEGDEFREESVNWNRFPLKEMSRRGYFGTHSKKNVDINSLMEDFFRPLGSPAHFFGMLRTSSYRVLRPMDKHALVAWSGFVFRQTQSITFPSNFQKGNLNLDFLRKVAQLSKEDRGPMLAIDFLKESGIALVIEPHFPRTYLDGATILIDKHHPVIGLTIRYDRLDNFWFTLLHELAHIALHWDKRINFFYDDLVDNPMSSDALERAADTFASEALIPQSKWESSPAYLIPSPVAAESLARELGICTAIVAGRMRRDNDRYQYLTTIINQAKVRKFFPGKAWPK